MSYGLMFGSVQAVEIVAQTWFALMLRTAQANDKKWDLGSVLGEKDEKTVKYVSISDSVKGFPFQVKLDLMIVNQMSRKFMLCHNNWSHGVA